MYESESEYLINIASLGYEGKICYNQTNVIPCFCQNVKIRRSCNYENHVPPKLFYTYTWTGDIFGVVFVLPGKTLMFVYQESEMGTVFDRLCYKARD